MGNTRERYNLGLCFLTSLLVAACGGDDGQIDGAAATPMEGTTAGAGNGVSVEVSHRTGKLTPSISHRIGSSAK
jgi:hypothetical protein